MNLRVKEELERIIKGIEKSEEIYKDSSYREYTTAIHKTVFIELKKYLPSEIEYLIIDDTPNYYKVEFWRE